MKLSRFFSTLVCGAAVAVSMTGCGGDKTVSVEGVTLSQSKLSLKVGSESKLTATVTPADATDPTVTWKSGNESVATVTDGVVKGLSEGTATISVVTTDGLKTASCLVDVTDYHAESVALSQTSDITLTKGGTVTLTATVSPDNAVNKNVTWSSSDPAVATVSQNGEVTAVGGGEATITVTTVDGQKTASVKVIVNVPVQGVALSENSLTIYEGVPYTALKVTFTPEDCSNKEVELTYDEKVLTVSVAEDGTVTVLGNIEGSASLTVKTKDGGFEAKCEVKVLPTGTSVDEHNYGEYK
jgi:uncharacterized protein YjdB